MSANWFKVIVHLSLFVGLSPLWHLLVVAVVVVAVVVDSYWLFGSVISRSEFFISNWICCTSDTHTHTTLASTYLVETSVREVSESATSRRYWPY